jgi:hypothetical protein
MHLFVFVLLLYLLTAENIAKRYIYRTYIVLNMKSLILVLFTVLLFTAILSDGKQERQTLRVSSLTINFDKTDAAFTVNYNMDNLPKMYILLLGSKSLEPKIKSMFSNFDYQIVKMDQDKAILSVKNVSRLDKGYYLHDSRKFGETIDTVYIYTNDSSRAKEYSMINSTPPFFYRS